MLSRLAGFWMVAVLLLTGFAPLPQENPTPVVSLSVNAGYNGLFRENHWIPLYIRISNDGGATSGRLIVRPETSGNAFTNTYSTPIDLPAGARQTVFLYVTARSFANQVRVELISSDGLVIAAQEAPMRGVPEQDQIHVVLTQSSAGSVDLSNVHGGGSNAFQANWLIDEMPDTAMALRAINTLVFSDIDTGTLSVGQRAALTDWVAHGGHLIVTGGTNWQATASGVENLLPLLPESSATIAELRPLAALAHDDAPLTGDTVIATGTLTSDAQVLAANEDVVPLLARRAHGLGTVDYLAADPLTQPLRDWNGLGSLWLALAASRDPVPGWVNGFANLDRATSAAEILPGFDLLPNVLPLCGFLALYVALIGPLNYVVLNRINRREFAWLTIPFFIVVFSVLAWVVGFNLRGNVVTFSRLAVVQSWADNDQAQVDGLIGLLSPRRTTYTLTVDDGMFLRPIGRSIQANPFAGSVQASTEITQAGMFQATDFLVDASFIATFAASGTLPKPDISGQAVMIYDQNQAHWVVRGSVRNDSAITLTNPVILARGEPLRLGEALEPGAVRSFDLPLDNRDKPAAPSPLERNPGLLLPTIGFQRFSADIRATDQSIIDVLGPEIFNQRAYLTGAGIATQDQENRRRQLFLSSFTTDHYFSTNRGDNVFLAGWSDVMPLEIDLTNATWDTIDTTLHIIELAVERANITGQVRVNQEQFTWMAEERSGVTSSLAPVNTVLQPGDSAAFRFTPLNSALLSQVDELRLVVDTPATLRTSVLMEIWDWDARIWEVKELLAMEESPSIAEHLIAEPAPYLGPRNAVLIRLVPDEGVSFVRYLRIGVEQVGRF